MFNCGDLFIDGGRSFQGEQEFDAYCFRILGKSFENTLQRLGSVSFVNFDLVKRK
jgi:hypothetical protein